MLLNRSDLENSNNLEKMRQLRKSRHDGRKTITDLLVQQPQHSFTIVVSEASTPATPPIVWSTELLLPTLNT